MSRNISNVRLVQNNNKQKRLSLENQERAFFISSQNEKGESWLLHSPHTSTHIVFCAQASLQEPLCSSAT
jgi:hypothetical protein